MFEKYEKIYEWFDQHRSRDLFEKPWLDKATSNLSVGASILDLGCGMGEPIARYFIEKGYKVTGIDGSRKLIDMAKERLPQGNFFVSDMRQLSLGSRFDMIIAWNSFFHLTKDEQRDMFALFSSHMNNEGILLFTSGSDEGEVWSDNGGENLYHASLSPEEYKSLLIKYGFGLIEFKLNDKDCKDHSVWLAKRME